ncbi:hypothetical protein [Caulobacter sp. RHG1]|uniref:hypothetical protein n=1 Tax=Caulobacter sp. (strain RHG1) TaxID=2545762 RepID=UPI00155312A1|nr:hypothetical protein [Caulobacter sp. RHG1]NQE62972.1 hypothetical protein [Caulobacter sp. RHG1]
MAYLETVSVDGDRLHLKWCKDGQLLPEQITMKSEFAAREAAGLLDVIKPSFRSEAMVRNILKTVPTGPRRSK